MSKTLCYGIITILVLMLINSCESPAKVEDISDPSNIKPQILLSKVINNSDKSAISLITVKLKDKDENYIELENGNIFVNGKIMSPPSSNGSGSETKYYKLSLPVAADSIYIFEVHFPGEIIAYAWIETPEIDLSEMTIPLEHARNTSLSIQWPEKDFRYPQTVWIQNWNASDGFSSDHQTSLNILRPDLGVFVIPAQYITYGNVSDALTEETRIYLVAHSVGILEDAFMEGGYIECQFQLFQDIYVY